MLSDVADMAMKKDYFVSQMLTSQQALDILIENDIFMARAESNDRFAEFFTSPLFRTTILKYATIRRYAANSAVVPLLAGDISYFSTILNDTTASSNIFTSAAASTPLIRNAVLTTAILAHDAALTKIFDNFVAVGTPIINDTQVQQQLFANSAAFWRKMFEYASVQTYIVSTNGGTFKDRIAASSLLQPYTYTVSSARGVKRSGDIYYLSARVTATNGSGTSTHYQGLGSDNNNTSVFTLSPGNMTTTTWTNVSRFLRAIDAGTGAGGSGSFECRFIPRPS